MQLVRRGSETCKEVLRLANCFSKHFHEHQFNGFKEAADEPVLALAMAVQHCMPLVAMMLYTNYGRIGK